MSTVTWLLRHGLLLGPAALVVTIVLVAALWRALAWRHAAHAGRRARGGSEPLEADLDTVDEGDTVTLAGTLELVGGARQHPADGTDAGVITVATSRRRAWLAQSKVALEASWRAAELHLVVRGTPVVLDGPIELGVGAREWWPLVVLGRLPAAAAERLPHRELEQSSWNSMQSSWAVFRAVTDGDEVVVRGALRRRGAEHDREGSGYRSQDARWRLSGVDGASLHMVALRDPRPHMAWSRLVRTNPVWIAGLLPMLALMLGGWWFTDAESDCADHGPCMWTGQCAGSVVDLWPPHVVCHAARPEHCTRSAECRRSGLCTFRRRQCEAAEGDCHQSEFCKLAGRCTALRGECVAESDAQCARSMDCRDHGACTAQRGECVQSPARKCAEHDQCLRDGRCTHHEGQCVVGGAEDCARSTGCSQHGLCRMGRPVSGTVLHCIAGRDEDCARAEVCKRSGGCRVHEGRCVAQSDEDCTQAQVCKNGGLCRALEGRCVNARGRDACQTSPECASEGKCSPQGLQCIAGSDADCQQAPRCRQSGLCRASQGRCIARTDSDCQQAEICTMHDACRAVDGMCQIHERE